MRPTGIIGIGYSVPERKLTNADLEKIVDTSDEWITARTGIRERRIADPEVATSDLAVEAGAKALADAGLTPGDIDLVIVATSTGDYRVPHTASLVQHALAIPRAAAYDLAAGCSGFVYALDQAWHGVRSGGYRNVLVIGAELISRMVNWEDRSTCVLFGDGAGAAVVGVTQEGYGLRSTYLGSDGSGWDKLQVPVGGSRQAVTPENMARGEHLLHMAGNEVFKFAVRIMADAALEVRDRAGWAPGDVDLFVPHQANIRIIEAAAKRLELTDSRIFVNVQRYGNTSAASIPIALAEAVEGGRLKRGDNVVCVGFGAGLSWGAAALRWGGAGTGVAS